MLSPGGNTFCVYAEATRAAARRKVVPVRAANLDPKQIPLPFNAVHPRHACPLPRALMA
jgi:hypothetical protein